MKLSYSHNYNLVDSFDVKGGKIRIKEPDSYNQEVVNKEYRDQEQITNKFMNEMHKNYDYLSKNNK